MEQEAMQSDLNSIKILLQKEIAGISHKQHIDTIKDDFQLKRLQQEADSDYLLSSKEYCSDSENNKTISRDVWEVGWLDIAAKVEDMANKIRREESEMHGEGIVDLTNVDSLQPDSDEEEFTMVTHRRHTKRKDAQVTPRVTRNAAKKKDGMVLPVTGSHHSKMASQDSPTSIK
ncbi:unnamed protein product [Cuscuta europaea]|uniref:Uncharacterized protein n=1 Tax=Cuscuta europaea TaxID=41803 RepID=A0A9P1EBE3_CUSEU|nr:unnamed protein product [Cuscuta europaea]